MTVMNRTLASAASGSTEHGFAVSALGITYQATLIDGKTIAFETSIDATVDREDLDARLDVFIGAADRQRAKEELPLVREALSVNLAKLKELEKRRASLDARVAAKAALLAASRRNPRPPAQGSEEANLAQFGIDIEKVKTQIRVARARIPYLRAIIDRREPPDPFPYPLEEESAAGEQGESASAEADAAA